MLIEELDPRFQLRHRALQNLYVRSSTTQKLVPLSILASVKPALPRGDFINHQGSLPATTLSFNLAPGACAERCGECDRCGALNAGMPFDRHCNVQGTAQAFPRLVRSQPWLILAAVIGGVHSSWVSSTRVFIHPLTIISTLPFAGLGALLSICSSVKISPSSA